MAIDRNEINRLVGRLTSHIDTLTSRGMPRDLVHDIFAATCIVDELWQLLETVERVTDPRAVAIGIAHEANFRFAISDPENAGGA